MKLSTRQLLEQVRITKLELEIWKEIVDQGRLSSEELEVAIDRRTEARVHYERAIIDFAAHKSVFLPVYPLEEK